MFSKHNSKKLLLTIGSAGVAVLLIYAALGSSEDADLDRQEDLKPEEDLSTRPLDTGQEEEAPNMYVEEIMTDCGTQIDCVVDGMRDLAGNEERGVVMATFDDLISKYQETVIDCHPHAHHLGMWLYGYLGNLDEALSYTDQRCAGGLGHGILEAYFLRETQLNKTDPTDIDITKICAENPENRYDLDRWNCLHGMGHGLIVAYDYDAFAAVQRCDELEPGWEQISCSKGVFMQNVVEYHYTGNGTFDEDDLFFPCNAVEPKYAPSCYHYHAWYVLLQNGFALRNSFQACDTIAQEEYMRYCYHGLGRAFVTDVFEKMERSIGMCQIGEQERYHSDCFRGLVIALVAEKGPEQALELCGLIPAEFKTDCYDGVGKWILMMHPTTDARAEECSKAENSEYYEICMKQSLEALSFL